MLSLGTGGCGAPGTVKVDWGHVDTDKGRPSVGRRGVLLPHSSFVVCVISPEWTGDYRL